MNINISQRRLIIIIVSVALIIGGCLLRYKSFEYSYETTQSRIIDSNGADTVVTMINPPLRKQVFEGLSSLCFSLAGGIIIAAFISSVIKQEQIEKETLALEKLRETLHIDIHDALFQKIIPEPIFSTIKKEIISSDIIRRDAEWYLDFTEKPNGIICLKMTCKFNAHNNTNSIIKNPMYPTTIANHNVGETSIDQIICSLDNNEIVRFDKNNKAVNKGVDIHVVDENIQHIHYTLEIPPAKYVEDTMVLSTHYKERVQDEMFTLLPLINLKIIANYPEGYTFSVFSMVSPDLNRKLEEKTRSIFEAKGGILPRQGIVYYLNRKVPSKLING
jgi:hypothetical protein